MSTITIIGNTTDDPVLRMAGDRAVANVTVVENERRRNAQGEWEDGDPSFYDVTCWGSLGENVSESIPKGTRVLVIGRMKQDRWEKDGEKRSAHKVTADAIGPDLTWATAEVTRKTKAGNGQAKAKASSGGGGGFE